MTSFVLLLRSPELMDKRYTTEIYQLEINALLLPKPSKTSKSRNHLDALERRLQLWESGEIKSSLLEAQTFQQRLTSNNDPKKYCQRFEKVCDADGER